MTLFQAATRREYETAERRYRLAPHGYRRSRLRALQRAMARMLDDDLRRKDCPACGKPVSSYEVWAPSK